MSDHGEHLAIIQLDDRKRARLGRYVTREPVAGWRLFREDEGKRIILEAVELT